MNDWGRVLLEVGARPRSAPSANAKTQATITGDVNAPFRKAIEAVPAAVYMTDADGRLTFYNEAAAELWGCRPELHESKFCGSWKLYWPDGTPLPHDECPMALALRHRRPIRGKEAIAERPDGTRISFIPYPTPLFDESGRLTGAVNMLVDISERKRTEAVLEERNAQFELVSRIALIGSYSYDYRTRTLQLSPGCAAIYGFPETMREITQTDWRARVHPDDLPRIDATSFQALAQRQSELVLEFRIVRPNGVHKWIEARVLISYDGAGRAVHMIGANIDVTERKQTAQALAERTVQLALAGKAALVGSYAYDTGTEIMQVSEGYAAIHGLPEGTVELARSKCLATIHSEDIERVILLRKEAFDLHRKEYSVEYRIVRAGGEVRWVETRCFISYDDTEIPRRVVGVSIDITQRKRVDEQQRRLVAELDHRVKNVLATVQAVAAHTMDASSSMEHFVAALDGRIRSLKGTHEILSDRRWLGIPLAELVQRELAPYATDSNVEIGGPEVMLSAEAGQIIGMVLHELATNAAKHGALSAPSGRVSIKWRLPIKGSASDNLVFKWREAGGPVPVSPSKSSYGMSVVRELIPYELDGTVEHLLSPEGAQCEMDIPLARLLCWGA